MATSPSRSILSTTAANTSPSKASSQNPSVTQPSSDSYLTASENQSSTQVKSMDYHRQVLKGKLEDDSNGAKYVSPSDTIMSPCTQKLSALKGRQFGKVKPKSLFAQTAGKSAGGRGIDEVVDGKEKGVGK